MNKKIIEGCDKSDIRSEYVELGGVYIFARWADHFRRIFQPCELAYVPEVNFKWVDGAFTANKQMAGRSELMSAVGTTVHFYAPAHQAPTMEVMTAAGENIHLRR